MKIGDAHALLPVVLATTGCSFKEANAGHEVVLIEKPWILGMEDRPDTCTCRNDYHHGHHGRH